MMVRGQSVLSLCALAALSFASLPENNHPIRCANHTLSNPSVFGAHITSITARPLEDYQGIAHNDVCFVNVTLTHVGTGDSVNNYIALPLKGWNGIFQGIGGNGYSAGNLNDMANQTILGYATGTTDAGHNISAAVENTSSPWALISPGNVNMDLTLNFARRSLHDMTVVGKAITESFYGQAPLHSYWNGCSTGGRQGLVIAQYYPDDYDGIIASAPAVQWSDMTPSQFWPYTVQVSENYTLQPCELEAAVNETIKACDGIDGLIDGLIDAPALCHFKAQSIVGKEFACVNGGENSALHNPSKFTFSQRAATVIDKIWRGPHTPEGQWLWYGFTRGANLTSVVPNLAGDTSPTPNPIPAYFFQDFLAKNPQFNVSSIDYAKYSQIVLQSHLEWDSTFGSASADLRAFAARGGKLITWQGLADNLIPPQGTMLYYLRVAALHPRVRDFYRQFYSPGVGHCGTGGTGVQPLDPVGQLRAWVENATAPDTLRAASLYPFNASADTRVRPGGFRRFVDLCPWPEVAEYDGKGNASEARSWRCVADSGWTEFKGPRGASFEKCMGPPGWY